MDRQLTRRAGDLVVVIRGGGEFRMLESTTVAGDCVHHWVNLSLGDKSFVFSQKGGRGRAYVSYPTSTEYGFDGASEFS